MLRNRKRFFYKNPLYHNSARKKNPEAATPSVVTASAKEAETVANLEVMSAYNPKVAHNIPLL